MFFRYHSAEEEPLKKGKKQCDPMDFRLPTSSKIIQNFSPHCGTFSPSPLSHSPAAKSLTPCDVSEPRPPRQMVRVVFCACPVPLLMYCPSPGA